MYAYASYALEHPTEITFVAVAELDNAKRQKFSEMHNVSEDMQFETGRVISERKAL